MFLNILTKILQIAQMFMNILIYKSCIVITHTSVQSAGTKNIITPEKHEK